jgi:RNA polymerase-binding transcription factor DksA
MTDQQAGQTGTDDGYLLSSLRTAYMDTRQRLEQLCVQAADRIEALTTQLAEDADVRKQIDHRIEELVGQVDALTAERDRQYDENVHRIFMQAKAETERDEAKQSEANAWVQWNALLVIKQGTYAFCGNCGESLRGERFCHVPRAASTLESKPNN